MSSDFKINHSGVIIIKKKIKYKKKFFEIFDLIKSFNTDKHNRYPETDPGVKN